MTHVTCRLPSTGISSRTLRLVIEYGLPFLSFTAACSLPVGGHDGRVGGGCQHVCMVVTVWVSARLSVQSSRKVASLAFRCDSRDRRRFLCPARLRLRSARRRRRSRQQPGISVVGDLPSILSVGRSLLDLVCQIQGRPHHLYRRMHT